jgi:hypothetical protein
VSYSQNEIWFLGGVILFAGNQANPARRKSTVCCAGITDPVPYRDLPGQRQFQKYDIVEVTAERSEPHKDDRPESWRPRLDTMKIVDHIEQILL